MAKNNAELMMLPIDKETGQVIESSRTARARRSVGTQFAMVGGAVLIGVFGLRANNQGKSARRTITPSPVTAGPHNSPNTVNNSTTSSLPANESHVVRSHYHDGSEASFQADCYEQATVTVRTQRDTLYSESVRGLKETDLITSYVYDANVDYSEEHGLTLADFKKMKPGSKYTVLSDCVITLPLEVGGGVSPFYDRLYQTGNSIFEYNDKNQLVYCNSGPECLEQGPPSP
jgi:hypothetical protein